MIRYILQRLFGMIVVMFLVVTIVFVIVRVTPGDPAAVMLGPDATAQDIASLRARLGLDQPLALQYLYYFGQLLRGDLGQSIFLNEPVTAALVERAEPTFFLTVFSLIIASVIALPIGIYSAYRRGSLFDQAATATCDACGQYPELLARSHPHSVFRRSSRYLPRLRLWRARFVIWGPDVSPGATLDRARCRLLGTDPSLHSRFDAGCAW